MNKEMLITSLINHGWAYQEGAFPEVFCSELVQEAQALQWQEAKIGKGAGQQLQQSIRNDSIFWLSHSPTSTLQKSYLDSMNEFMQSLNRELYLGLKDYECHFALYKESGFYKKHLDQHAGSNARSVSTIMYLNTPLSGGELVIYKRENTEEVETKITPKAGSFVCFLSNQIYHEVLPTLTPRYSLTGWFRTTPA
jgi:SM-20-related protein